MMKKTWEEFKAFAMKGNVVDMAVGVVVGGGFSKVVSSLVNDIIMPLISVLIGDVNFTNWKWVLSPGTQGTDPIVVHYGSFIQTALDFFIIAFSIFLTIKVVTKMSNRLKAQEEAEQPAATEPTPTQEEILLTEIRDILKAEK